MMQPHVLKRYIETLVSELLGYGWNDQLMNDGMDTVLDGAYEDHQFFIKIDVEDDEMFITATVCSPRVKEILYTKKYRLTLTDI